MKRFYILFLSLPLISLSLIYLPLWWSIGANAATLIFIIYRFYAEELEAAIAKSEMLQSDLDDLNIHLEQAVLKEQKTSKEAAQVKQSKHELLSVLSHEIRTPLNGVMGMTLLLEDTPVTKEQKEYISTIHSCSESLLTTVNSILANDLLDFSKLQQQGQQLRYENFGLQDCIEEVLELFAEKAGAAGVELLYDVAEDVPAGLMGDSNSLKQVLINLVENAVRYTRKGEILINVRSAALLQPGAPLFVDFEVKDTGTGIAAAQLKNLFKGIPGKDFSKGEQKSTGLGLVVCKKLVELMGGHIAATSQPGQGSCFSFSIPLAASIKPVYKSDEQNNASKLQGKHVLVVIGNESSRTNLIKKFKGWKIISHTAGNVPQAMELLSSQQHFDLVIADLNMPGTDKLIKQYPSLPLIGLRTPADPFNLTEVGKSIPVIVKPIRQHILKDKLVGIFSGTGTAPLESMSGLFAEQYPLRILVAEDNLINQKIATKILTKLGYEPALANNGKEVLEMIGQDPYDIILMDVQMPEMNGLEATRMIRTCLEIQPIIIALTANVMQGDRDECMQAGMDDYMSKPIELKELLSRLEKWSLELRGRKKISA